MKSIEDAVQAQVAAEMDYKPENRLPRERLERLGKMMMKIHDDYYRQELHGMR